MKIVQTAGRAALGEFAPEFAHFNDDVLFGENWNNQDIDVKTRSIITVVAIMSSGITDSSLKYHLQNAKAHGVTQKEIAAIITHVAFYAGWPKGWAVFNLAKEVWEADEGELPYEDEAMKVNQIEEQQNLMAEMIQELQERDRQLLFFQEQNQSLKNLNSELSGLLNLLPDTEELLSQIEQQKTRIEQLETENQQWQELTQKLNSENSLLQKQNTELLTLNSR